MGLAAWRHLAFRTPGGNVADIQAYSLISAETNSVSSASVALVPHASRPHAPLTRQIWTLSLVALLFIISQLSALYTLNVQSLWIVSTLLGLSYGSLFNVVPMLVLEWFGIRESVMDLASLSPYEDANQQLISAK